MKATENGETSPSDEIDERTYSVEMKPRWWRKAQEAAGVARREIKGMHEFEREVHDTTVEDCHSLIEQINTSGVIDSDESWETLELTAMDIQILWEGVVDMHFLARDKAGGEWSDVEHGRPWKWLYGTLAYLSRKHAELGVER